MTLFRTAPRNILIFMAILCTPLHAGASGFFGLSIGYFNAFDGDKNSATFRAEFIADSPVFLKNLKPWGGAELTTNGTFWLGGGLLYDFALNNKLSLTPSLGAGFYHHGAGDKDLGYPLEFRSQIALNYALTSQSSLGIAFSHTSNAGFGRKNPGAETIALTYTRALSSMTKPDQI